MTRILNSYFLPYIDTNQKHLGKICEEICEKVYFIAKKFFHFLYVNKFFLVAICSSLLIHKSTTSAQFIETEKDKYISCENMLCKAWNDSRLYHQLFSPIIQFRCDRFHPYYAPFPYPNKCMNTLCDYIHRVGREFPECETFNNFSLDPLNLFWRELCPQKQNIQEDLKGLCLAGECTKNDVFKIITALRGFCYNNRIPELVRDIRHTTDPRDIVGIGSHKWSEKDLLFEVLDKYITFIRSISSYLTRILHIIDKTVMENDIIYHLRNGVEKANDVIGKAIRDELSYGKFTEKFGSNFEKPLLRIADKLENLFAYPTSQAELGNSVDEFVDLPGNKIMDLINYSKEAYHAFSLPALSNGVSPIKGKQYELLLSSIDNWNSAYCFYSRPNKIWCRLPLPSSIAQINQIFSRSKDFYTKNFYCHFIDDDYWCNFGKFLKAVCNNRNITRFSKCLMDHMILEIKKTPDNFAYQINLVGDCYHETFIVKKC